MPAHAPIPIVTLADGMKVPALGLGTWRMGERRERASREIAALRAGIEAGMTLIDTAEMYGDGGAERVVASAVGAQRDAAFIVSKVSPHNASAKGTVAACERSLSRLRTDRIDLYLLHWPGRHPLAETIDAFERLRATGKIVRWGVSNFDVADMQEVWSLRDGARCTVNQVLYNLSERGVEWKLRALCQQHDVAIMAYSPLHQGALLTHRKLATVAATLGVAPAQLALAWLLRQRNVIVIAKSANLDHVAQCRAAADMRLAPDALAALDAAFPPPRRAGRLSVI
ncbi:MAG TPA: aldo/keto reductase [Casimicrobiaceae bacterium]|nr:aldo/keto reductase [Casimicrobiaceae bacterium]